MPRQVTHIITLQTIGANKHLLYRNRIHTIHSKAVFEVGCSTKIFVYLKRFIRMIYLFDPVQRVGSKAFCVTFRKAFTCHRHFSFTNWALELTQHIPAALEQPKTIWCKWECGATVTAILLITQLYSDFAPHCIYDGLQEVAFTWNDLQKNTIGQADIFRENVIHRDGWQHPVLDRVLR